MRSGSTNCTGARVDGREAKSWAKSQGWTRWVVVAGVAMSHTGAAGPCAARALTLPDGAIRYRDPAATLSSPATSVGSMSGATSIKSLVLDTGITGMSSSSGFFTNPISSQVTGEQ